MERQTGSSLLPERMRILSGSALKLTAVITMLIDHIGAHILSSCSWAREPLLTLPWETLTLYSLSRSIGRIAFPIYCFLLTEGFMHTRSRWRYAWNLFLFACLSELPWNYVHTGNLTYPKQNVFFTLFLGYLGICALGAELPACLDRLQGSGRRLLRFALAFAVLVVSMYLQADYGWRGYLFILIMYGFRTDPALQALIGGGWLYYEWKAVFAFLPINMYNGKRGFIHGGFLKYFFYAFYPLHLLILGLIRFR